MVKLSTNSELLENVHNLGPDPGNSLMKNQKNVDQYPSVSRVKFEGLLFISFSQQYFHRFLQKMVYQAYKTASLTLYHVKQYEGLLFFSGTEDSISRYCNTGSCFKYMAGIYQNTMIGITQHDTA